jgi:tetratricopeptide (TPR) repeat protein
MKRPRNKKETAPKPITAPASTPTPTPLLPVAVFLAAVIALTAAAAARNSIYRTPVTLWESAVKSSPDKQRPHENYGQALSTAGKLAEALEQFKTVLALPEDGSVPMRDVNREIGVVYFRLGLIDEAILSWQKGLQYAPFDPGLLNNLSVAYMKKQRLDEALSHAQTALRVNPYMPEPTNTLGEIYLATGRYEEAARAFLQYVQLRPEDPRGYWNAAIAMERSGNYEQAQQLASRFAALERDERYRKLAQDFINKLQAAMNEKKR